MIGGNKIINLKLIRIDGGTQPRESINMETVSDYAEGVKVGIEFPPVIAFYDGAEYWLADGFHRYHAHTKAGRASIQADVRQGSLDDAKLFASGANSDHGLRRSNADKRLAVLMALGVKGDWSDNRIATHVGVSHTFVAEIRRSILQPLQDRPPVRTVERAGKTYQQDTANIGKTRSAQPSAPEVPEEFQDDAPDAVAILSEENDRLNDRLAVAAMDATDEERGAAVETISELRAQVKTLEAELHAVRASRDNLMTENNEMKRQIAGQRRQLQKLQATPPAPNGGSSGENHAATRGPD